MQHLSGYYLSLKFDPELLFGSQFQYRNRIAVEFNQLYHWHGLMPDSFIIQGQEYSYKQFLYNTSMLMDYGVEALVESFSKQVAGRVRSCSAVPGGTRVQWCPCHTESAQGSPHGHIRSPPHTHRGEAGPGSPGCLPSLLCSKHSGDARAGGNRDVPARLRSRGAAGPGAAPGTVLCCHRMDVFCQAIAAPFLTLFVPSSPAEAEPEALWAFGFSQ